MGDSEGNSDHEDKYAKRNKANLGGRVELDGLDDAAKGSDDQVTSEDKNKQREGVAAKKGVEGQKEAREEATVGKEEKKGGEGEAKRGVEAKDKKCADDAKKVEGQKEAEEEATMGKEDKKGGEGEAKRGVEAKDGKCADDAKKGDDGESKKGKEAMQRRGTGLRMPRRTCQWRMQEWIALTGVRILKLKMLCKNQQVIPLIWRPCWSFLVCKERSATAPVTNFLVHASCSPFDIAYVFCTMCF